MSLVKQQTMKVSIDGQLADREVAHLTKAFQADGTTIEYPEPLLEHNEVVFRPGRNLPPIIVVRTIPA